MSLLDRSVRDLLAAFASDAPTPGGGSAAALSSAIGASLLAMVAALPKTREGSDSDRAALQAAAAALVGVRQQLAEAIDADSAAYDHVVAAYKLPKATPDDQQARKRAIQHALRAATDVPLGVMRLSAEGLDQARAVAAHGYKSASSDVGVAIAMLHAGAHGARLNVEVNLGGVSDAVYKDAVSTEVRRLTAAVDERSKEAETSLPATSG